MANRTPYVVCPNCKANLDYGETCDCQKITIDAASIGESDLNRMARPLLEAVRESFEDPEFAAGFEQWQKNRKGNAG